MRLVWLACLLVTELALGDQSLSNRLDAAHQLKAQGKLTEAATAYASLLPELRQAPDRPQCAQALLDAGEIALSMGEYGVAESDATESARVFHELKDRPKEAAAIHTGGLALLDLGEYTDALEHFQQVLSIDIAEHETEGEIIALNNIANVHFFQGKYTEALAGYEQALARVDATRAETWNPKRRQLTLVNLAALYEQLGLNQKALVYYEAAQADGDIFPTDERVQLLSNLGNLYRRLGDPAKAVEAYRKAQKLSVGDPHADGQIHVLQNIGIALALDYGDLGGALNSFTEALRQTEAAASKREIVLARLYRGETLFRMDRLPEARREYDLGLAAAREIAALDEEWTAEYGMGRVASKTGDRDAAADWFGRAIATIESQRSGLGRPLKKEFLANQRNVYDGAIELLLAHQGPDREQLFTFLEQARSRNLPDQLRKSLKRGSIGAVQQALRKDALLVEYWLGAGRMAAFWVTSTGSGWVSRDITAQQIETIRTLAATLPGSRDTGWRKPAAQLSELLFAGIPLDKGTAHLLIVPDGILSNLPFELLSAPGDGQLLIERYAISYLPAAALLLRNREDPRTILPWRTRLLAMSDPIVPAGGPLESGRQWTRMPRAADEIRSIAAAIRGRSRIFADNDDFKRHLADDAVAGISILHLSTHATVDLEEPSRSRILFTPEPGNRGSEYLFWPEAQSLPLDGVDLVTLPACEIEGGKILRAEGIQNFSRAFLAAGARSTVTTLWPVPETPTTEFMRQFYGHLSRGETRAEALRSAKLSFLKAAPEFSHPRFWAAFVLNGDGQQPLQPVLSWWWIVLPAALGILMAVRFFRRRTVR